MSPSEFSRGCIRSFGSFKMTDTRPVCMEDVNPDTDANTHRLDCGHLFHSPCIIEWFQRGHLSCPTCRADNHSESLPCMSVHVRAKFIRSTIGRRKSAPPELKMMITQLQNAESDLREHTRDLKLFKREHAAILKKSRACHEKKWRLRQRVRQRERLLGLFQTPTLTLPTLAVLG